MTKTAPWEDLEKRANTVADRLGKGLDENIKETVMSFWLAGFETIDSCEGHLDWGLKGPWIGIGIRPFSYELEPIKGKSFPIAQIFEQNPNLKKIRDNNLKSQKRLLMLLSEFYKNRGILEDERLVIRRSNIYGGIRLENQGIDIQEINSRFEQEQKLKTYQNEMQDFAVFLKNKYLPTQT